MATFDVAKLLNKITQDIPGINTVLKALANWDVSALSDVPDGAMQATTDANNNLTIKKKVSDSYTPVAKLMHDVDKLDGYHASASATANAVAVRNAQGALPGNITGNAATADTATALAAGSVVPVSQGGTGATTASQARTNLGVAGSADFTAHIAKQSSPSVEGHVKLDALAADGSNTAAPGGFGLGMPEAKQITANTDLDSVVLPGFYSCRRNATAVTLLNCPVTTAFSMLVEFGAYGPTQTITTHDGGARFQRTKKSSTTFGTWRSLPDGISDSTSTTSSNIAASATAVKTAYDRAEKVATASISGGIKVGGAISSVSSDGTVTLSSATTTSRGIARVATLADMEPGAVVENGPAVLAADGDYHLPVSWVPGLFVGDIRLLPFRAADLATHCPGWYFCNGDQYALTSPVGSKLNSLPANFKSDWGITVSGGNISIPNFFYADGRGYFLRAVDNISRFVGSIELDAFASHDHAYNRPEFTFGSGDKYPLCCGSATSSPTSTSGGSETRPINRGMTAAIFLDV